MIGRFSKLGVYQELFRLRDFYLAVSAAALALLSFIIDYGNNSTSIVGNTLAIISVAINGAPIIWGAVKGMLNREVNVDELVSLAIIASLIQGEFLTAAVVSFVMTTGCLSAMSLFCPGSALMSYSSLPLIKRHFSVMTAVLRHFSGCAIRCEWTNRTRSLSFASSPSMIGPSDTPSIGGPSGFFNAHISVSVGRISIWAQS